MPGKPFDAELPSSHLAEKSRTRSLASVRMIRTVLILEHDTHGELERKIFHAGMTSAEARALLWEAIKDITPGVRN